MSGVGGGGDSHLYEPRSEAVRIPPKPSYEVVRYNESKAWCDDVISSSARQTDPAADRSTPSCDPPPKRNSGGKQVPTALYGLMYTSRRTRNCFHTVVYLLLGISLVQEFRFLNYDPGDWIRDRWASSISLLVSQTNRQLPFFNK